MKTGLKLWSSNIGSYFEEARKLYGQGYFDYIELYVVPNTQDCMKKWQELDIPFILHAPHSAHGVNLADNAKREVNKKIYGEVKSYRDTLKADTVIVHSGMNGTAEEAIFQINAVKEDGFVIENKPYHPPFCLTSTSRGSTLEEVQKILSETGCGFCLDISHAICTANVFGLEPYEYLACFERLNPALYHLSDGQIDSVIDRHLHLGQGNYDFEKIFSVIKKNSVISLETQKLSKEHLNDFMPDAEYIGRIRKSV